MKCYIHKTWQANAVHIAASVGVLLLCVGILLAGVGLFVYNPRFYAREFKKLGVYDDIGLSREELHGARDMLIDYMKGKRDTLQLQVAFEGDDAPSDFYTEEELSHMADVKAVFVAVKVAEYILVPAGVGLLALVLLFGKPRDIFDELARAAMRGTIALFIVLGLIGLAVAVDFDAVFTVFHGIFFPQGNWQFAWDSRMLAMLPEALFMHAGIGIIAVGLGAALLLCALGVALRLLIKRGVLFGVGKPQNGPGEGHEEHDEIPAE
ncbi:MAG: TIGR01906 family membrane protein [Clostridiales bacterium]|jgi:integral membrane protein (TIGR01906 family)|nr:TIGR01906 family membrane protein [Clostridiales bacterium]